MIGHNLKYPGVVLLILERTTEEKNWVRRPGQNYEEQIMKDTTCRSYSETGAGQREVENSSKLVLVLITNQQQYIFTYGI